MAHFVRISRTYANLEKEIITRIPRVLPRRVLCSIFLRMRSRKGRKPDEPERCPPLKKPVLNELEFSTVNVITVPLRAAARIPLLLWSSQIRTRTVAHRVVPTMVAAQAPLAAATSNLRRPVQGLLF